MVDALDTEIKYRSLETVQEQINEMTERMLTAAPRDVPTLQYELQKLRVASIILRENRNGVSDPNAYKEMRLLVTMSKGIDDSPEKDSALETEEVARRLEERGINPESANAIAKVLGSVIRSSRTGFLDDEEEDGESDDPIPVSSSGRRE